MVSALPQVFAFPSKAVGVIDFTNASVVKAIQTIFDEILAVFPSRYVHMGGDEVNFGEVNGLPEIAAALKRENVTSSADLYRIFIGQMDTYAKANGKTLQVCEDHIYNTPRLHSDLDD
jgi:N-acetyl-beta-hexosaminidase